MKSSIYIVLFLFSVVSLFAQEPAGNIMELTEHEQQIKANKEAFKASLTDEQRQLLNDNLLTKEQKREAFRASLSANQKKMLLENKKALQQHKNLKQNFSNQQKTELRKDIKKKRERLKRVVRRTRLNSINH